MTVLILFLGFFILLMAGLPVVWAMAGGSIAALVFGDLHLPIAWLAQQTIRGADSSTLASIPLFLLAGELMNRGGLTLRIMRIAEHCFGRLRGGLGLVNVATAFVYGGLTGLATADTGTVAKVMIPVMEARGYPRAFAAAVTAASGTLGIIVPPSVILIMYGVLTNNLIGGISSAGRALPKIDGKSFQVLRSQGPYLWDMQGARYVDTALGFGASMLGHADAAVVDATCIALRNGPMPSFAHEAEEAAAAMLVRFTGELSKVIFLNTGSEAVHLACRTARIATGRQLIVKFAAGYDGWYDQVAFGNAGSSAAEMAGGVRPHRDGILLLRSG